MKWPALPRDERKTVKIKTSEYDRIFHLYWTDTPIYLIAILYNVNHKTIAAILFPHRRKIAYEKSKIFFAKYRADPERVKIQNRACLEWFHSTFKYRKGAKEYRYWYDHNRLLN